MTSSNKNILIKTLLYRSLHRGCKETDILLGLFATDKVQTFDDKQLQLYSNFILEDDAFIYDWILQKSKTPAKYQELVNSIRIFHNL